MKVGDIIDEKYEVVRLLGEGGMGRVFEGLHTRIGRKVALKVLRPHLATSTEVATRFLREAQTAAAVGSDHIVDIYDVGDTQEGMPYLVMEFLEGENLHTMVERVGRFEPGLACEFVRQACRGIAAAHQRNIIHRDLKPDNLFLTKLDDGCERVKIVDFGIAKFRDTFSDDEPRLTATGATIGTPYYMSPEQARASDDLDERTDIYSLGVILYELLTGRPPYNSRSFNELLIMIATATPESPRAFQPDLPEGLGAVVLKAMARSRGDRYGSAAELAKALEKYAKGLGEKGAVFSRTEHDISAAHTVRSQESSRLLPVPDVPDEHDGSDPVDSSGTPLAWQSGSEQAPKSSRRWRIGPVAALGALVVIVAVGAFWIVPNMFGEEGSTTEAEDHPQVEPMVETQTGDGVAEEQVRISRRLEIHVEPATAELRIDGVVSKGLPFVGHFPPDGDQLRIEASAEGYVPYGEYLTIEEDRVVTIRLEPSLEHIRAKSLRIEPVRSPQKNPVKGSQRKMLESPYE